MAEYSVAESYKKKKESGGYSTKVSDLYNSTQSRIVANDINEALKRMYDTHTSASNDYKSRFFDEEDNYIDAYRSDSSKALEGITSYQSAYNKDAEQVLSWLDKYGKYYDTDYVNELKTYLDSGKTNFTDMYSAYSADHDYMSRFKDLDDYNAAIEAQRIQKEKETADLDALWKELEPLKAQKDEYDSLKTRQAVIKKTMANGGRSQKLETEYASNEKRLKELEGATEAWSEKNAYYNDAKRIQDGIKLASDATSDPEFDKYAEQGASIENPTYREAQGIANIFGWRPFAKDINNKVTFSRDNAAEVGMGNTSTVGMLGDYKYTHMTDEEVEIYNYYLAKEGEEKADEFLKSIEQSLNAREGQQKYEFVENNMALELLFGAAAGADQFKQGIKSLFNTEGEYIPTSSTQIASGLIREDLADTSIPVWYNFKEGKWEDKVWGSSVGQMAYDLTNTSANMLPSILAGSVANLVAPGSGVFVSSGLMGASSAGNAYQEMVNLGYDKHQAKVYGNLVGLSEAALGTLLNGIGTVAGKGTKGILTQAFGKTLQGIDNGLARFALQFGGEMVSEGIEEGLQEILEPLLRNAIFYQGNDIDWESAAYSALLGALSAGVMNGATITTKMGTAIVNNAIESQKAKVTAGENVLKNNNLDSLVTSAQGLGNAKLKALANKVAGVDTSTLSKRKNAAYTKNVGKLYDKTLKAQAKEIGSVGYSTVEGIVKEKLNAKGVTDNSKIKTATKAISKALENMNKSANKADIVDNFKKMGENQGLTGTALDKSVDKSVKKFYDKVNKAAQWTKAEREVMEEIDGLDIVNSLYNNWEDVSVEIQKKSSDRIGQYAETASLTNNQFEISDIDTSDLNISEDGKTYYNGEEVEVTGIASIKDGKMSVNLSNGTRASLTDVSFGDATQAQLYQGVLNMGIDSASAQMIVKAFDGKGSKGDISVKTYLKGIEDSVRYGKIGAKSFLETGHFTSELTEKQRNDAYLVGEITSENAAKKKAKSISKTIELNKKKGSKTSVTGTLRYNGVDPNTLNYRQRASVKAIEVVFGAMGINVEIFESPVDENGKHTGENGSYDPKTDTIRIDIASGSYGQDLMLFTASHELTHFIQKWSDTKYKEFTDFLLKQYTREEIDVLVQKKIERSENSPTYEKPLTYEEAFDEVVADSCESFLRDSDLMKKLVELAKVDMSLFERTKLFIDEILADVKKAYSGMTPDSEEGRKVLEMVDCLDDLHKKWEAAALEARSNYQQSGGKIATKNTANSGVKKQTREASASNRANRYSYDVLISKPDILITQLSAVPRNELSAYIADKDLFAKDMRRIAINAKNKKNTATSTYLYCKDLGENVLITRDSFKHGAARMDATYISVCKNISDILNNSIVVNELSKREHTNGAYVLLGLAETNNDYVVVRSIINKKTWKLEEYNELNAIKEKGTKKEDVGPKPPHYAQKNGYGTSSSISISDFLTFVNSQKLGNSVLSLNILNHLDSKRGFDENVTPNLLYSDRVNDSMSNRALLANALESTIDTSTQDGQNELKRLTKYKGKISELDNLDSQLREIKQEIKEISFSSGKNRKRLIDLNAKAKSLADRISREDKKLLNMEAEKPIRQILERERQKATQKQRKRDAEILKRRNEGKTKTEMRHRIGKKIKAISKLLNRGTNEKNVKADIQETTASALALVDLLFSDTVSNEDIVRRGVKSATPEEKKLLKKYREKLNDREKYLVTIEAVRKADGNSSKKLINLLHNLDSTDKDLSKLNKDLKDVFVREKEGIRETKVSEAFEKLITAYEGIKNSENSYIKNAYEESILERIKEINNEIGGTYIKDMTYEQLDSVLNLLECIDFTIRNANTAFINGKRVDLAKLVKAVQSEILSHHKGGKDLLDWVAQIQDLWRFVSWEELKPIYAFDRLGSETMRSLYFEALKGEGEFGRLVEEAGNFISEQKEKYGYTDWEMEKAKTFKSANGLDFKLTLGDMMSIYAFSRRPQAEDHMIIGGFKFDVGRTYREGDPDNENEKGKKYRTPEMSETFRMDYKLIADIVSALTDEQKAYAESVQKYLTDLGAKGNEISRQLYGIDIFGEENYFPLKSVPDYRNSVEQALNNLLTQSTVKNSGFTKATKLHASDPIILQRFDDVVTDHIDDISKYIALAIPIENLRKVFNNVYKDIDTGYDATKVVISSTFGQSAERYFDKYITDLNGGIKTGDTSKAMKFFSRSKKVMTAASLSVWIQQYFSIIRSMSMINPKYFAPWENREAAQTEMESQWKELKIYAPVAIIKEMGGFDVGSSRSTKDYIGVTKYGIGDTFIDKAKGIAKGLAKDEKYRQITLDKVFGIGAEFMDKVGWISIWKAVKKEIADTTNLTPGTEEFLKACGERFNEVIAYTQVYDSVNSRSGFMRSKTDLNKFMTSYMGEPTTIVNMAYGAMLKWARNKTTENGKALARTMGAIAVSAFFTNLAKSIIYANKDDEDELTWTEKWMMHFGSSMKSDINPFNYLPWVRDVMSTIEGWNVDRPDMTLIADVVSSTEKLFKDGATWDEFWDWTGSVGNIFGIPLKNIFKDVKGIGNLIEEHFDDDTSSYEGHAFAEGFGKDGFKEIIFGGDYTIMEKIEDAFDHNDTETLKGEINRLLKDKEEEVKAKHPKYSSSEVTKRAKSSIRSKFTSTYKNDYIDAFTKGDLTEANRIRKILHATGLYGSLSELDNTLYKWRTEE